MTCDRWCATGIRWVKFNAVGGLGIVVQLAALAVLRGCLHLTYLCATALAVEVTVVHNFIWHEKFTWAVRSADRVYLRFARFNLTTGALSIVGNVVLMKLLVEAVHQNYLVANAIAIAACSVANFLVSDRLVFIN